MDFSELVPQIVPGRPRVIQDWLLRVYIYMCVYIYRYVCMYFHMYIYICIYLYTYTYVYIYISGYIEGVWFILGSYGLMEGYIGLYSENLGAPKIVCPILLASCFSLNPTLTLHPKTYKFLVGKGE